VTLLQHRGRSQDINSARGDLRYFFLALFSFSFATTRKTKRYVFSLVARALTAMKQNGPKCSNPSDGDVRRAASLRVGGGRSVG
jgi:hypothetical protein